MLSVVDGHAVARNGAKAQPVRDRNRPPEGRQDAPMRPIGGVLSWPTWGAVAVRPVIVRPPSPCDATRG